MQLGSGLLERFSHVRITAGSISIVCPSPPPPRPVEFDLEESADAARLACFLQGIDPALRGSRIQTLVLQAHFAALLFPASLEQTAAGGPVLHLLLSRNVQHHMVLGRPAQPAHLAATYGCLSGTFTRPAPGNANDVLIHIQRSV